MDERRVTRVLRQHVASDQLLGVDAVPCDGVAAPQGLAPSTSPASRAPAAPMPAPMPPPQRAYPAAPPAHGYSPPPSIPLPQPVVPGPPPISLPTPELLASLLRLGAADKAAVLAKLDTDEVRPCVRCGLCRGRIQTVFGEGDPNAALMFVGEGPGADEDQQGRPFVGRAGQKLDDIMRAMGLDRGQVFIANVVKCRPPENRVPTPEEADACYGHLLKQIAIVKPRVMVGLGASACKRLTNNPKFGITAERGKWFEYRALSGQGLTIPCMPTFHPSYLLRAYTPENRRKVWEDMQAVMAKLGLPAPAPKG